MKENAINKLFSIALTITFIASCVVVVVAQQKPVGRRTVAKSNDVLGWQETRWGMKKADIKRVLARYVAADDETKATTEPRLICDKLCALTRYQVANESFFVEFGFDGTTNGLNSVNLQALNAKYPQSLFEELEKLLTMKYGAFTYTENKSVGSLVDTSHHWSFRSTTIELRHRSTRDSTSITEIHFRPAGSSEATKL